MGCVNFYDNGVVIVMNSNGCISENAQRILENFAEACQSLETVQPVWRLHVQNISAISGSLMT